MVPLAWFAIRPLVNVPAKPMYPESNANSARMDTEIILTALHVIAIPMERINPKATLVPMVNANAKITLVESIVTPVRTSTSISPLVYLVDAMTKAALTTFVTKRQENVPVCQALKDPLVINVRTTTMTFPLANPANAMPKEARTMIAMSGRVTVTALPELRDKVVTSAGFNPLDFQTVENVNVSLLEH